VHLTQGFFWLYLSVSLPEDVSTPSSCKNLRAFSGVPAFFALTRSIDSRNSFSCFSLIAIVLTYPLGLGGLSEIDKWAVLTTGPVRGHVSPRLMSVETTRFLDDQ
jgi:hypothetical protein